MIFRQFLSRRPGARVTCLAEAAPLRALWWTTARDRALSRGGGAEVMRVTTSSKRTSSRPCIGSSTAAATVRALRPVPRVRPVFTFRTVDVADGESTRWERPHDVPAHARPHAR